VRFVRISLCALCVKSPTLVAITSVPGLTRILQSKHPKDRPVPFALKHPRQPTTKIFPTQRK
jgi:hypothetical protein